LLYSVCSFCLQEIVQKGGRGQAERFVVARVGAIDCHELSQRLHTKLGTDGTIEADRGRIRQILGNLLSNAMKFTPQGGLIEVSSQANDGLATIVLSDTGRGIEPALLPHIFERFRQAQSAEQGGLGLGLAIVRHLVELHGGDVRAESEGTGKGATFTVRLPLTALTW